MLSGHFQGRVLSILSKLISPKTILEIGTYTGYSAICLAEGLHQDGILHTIDINEELSDMQSTLFLTKVVLANRFIQHTRRCFKIIPTLKTNFDLVFIDADKQNYTYYFDLIIEK